MVTAEELAYRCGVLALSFVACGAYVPADGEVGRIRARWMHSAEVAFAASHLAFIATGRAKGPPLAIEDARDMPKGNR